MNRVQKAAIIKDLNKKMVILTGPRQAGKTWLAKDIATEFPNSIYLNYDVIKDKEIIQQQSWLPSTDLLILDELHKMDNWKNYLKGVFDARNDNMRILVTGSARLEIFNQIGDSLAGRYFKHRLLPFSVAELSQTKQFKSLQHIIEHSGFPEPYFADNIIEANRWRQQYISSLLSTDIFEIDTIHNLKAMNLVFELLRSRVGSPVSYQSLAEDAQVSPTTIKKYIEILEALYIVFKVTPYSKNIARSLLKEPKIYFFDTGLINGDIGAKYENLVALSLLKHCYAKTDYLAENYHLHYLRTKDGLEVDFALALNDEIEQIIEVKTADDNLSSSLKKFHFTYNFPATQVVANLKKERLSGNIAIVDLQKYLARLYL